MVRDIEVERLNAAPYNPRITLEPGMPEWDKLVASMEAFGNVEPIVWNEVTGHVVGGHQRLAVLLSMGTPKTIPCSVVSLPESEEKLLNVALNKIKGGWDFDKLEDLLAEFDAEVAQLSGFSADELAVLLASDDDLDGDEGYGDWDDSDDDLFLGGSYVISLVFETHEDAEDWAASEGYDGQIKAGATTTVIRIEEPEDCDGE
ncbi:MAG: ParB N-terminal domain-containing protein [Bacteroidales bacterium]|nr:ParB N-terminal domain-containing protein [Bacteroidales bacterium]